MTTSHLANTERKNSWLPEHFPHGYVSVARFQTYGHAYKQTNNSFFYFEFQEVQSTRRCSSIMICYAVLFTLINEFLNFISEQANVCHYTHIFLITVLNNFLTNTNWNWNPLLCTNIESQTIEKKSYVAIKHRPNSRAIIHLCCKHYSFLTRSLTQLILYGFTNIISCLQYSGMQNWSILLCYN